MPFGCDERRARVEPDVWISSDERVSGKALIFERVGDDEEIGLVNGVGAKGDVPLSLCRRQSDFATPEA